jgi:hypothetical protein
MKLSASKINSVSCIAFTSENVDWFASSPLTVFSPKNYKCSISFWAKPSPPNIKRRAITSAKPNQLKSCVLVQHSLRVSRSFEGAVHAVPGRENRADRGLLLVKWLRTEGIVCRLACTRSAPAEFPTTHIYMQKHAIFGMHHTQCEY